MCCPDVKLQLFQAYCTTFYCIQLWAVFTKRQYSTMRVAYNDALRRLFNFNLHWSASGMFDGMNILSFDAILRKCIHIFMQRLHNSENEIINVLCQHLMCLIICSGVTGGRAYMYNLLCVCERVYLSSFCPRTESSQFVSEFVSVQFLSKGLNPASSCVILYLCSFCPKD